MILIITTGKYKGKKFGIREGSNLVGRWDPASGSFPEIDLDEYDVDAKVSRKHAIIRRDGDSLTIKDIGSLNGTFINQGEKLDSDEEHDLKDGDEVVVGKIFLKVDFKDEA